MTLNPVILISRSIAVNVIRKLKVGLASVHIQALVMTMGKEVDNDLSCDRGYWGCYTCTGRNC